MELKNLVHVKKLNKQTLKSTEKEFLEEIINVSRRLQINPNWLMGVIELETGGSFDPSITNSLGYTGLIQFGKAAAKGIGTTTSKLRAMTALEQLRYVELYLKPYKSKIKRYADVYLAVFFPAAIGRPDGWVLHTSRLSAERIAKWNPLFDINKDKAIQIWEIKHKLLARIPESHKMIML